MFLNSLLHVFDCSRRIGDLLILQLASLSLALVFTSASVKAEIARAWDYPPGISFDPGAKAKKTVVFVWSADASSVAVFKTKIEPIIRKIRAGDKTTKLILLDVLTGSSDAFSLGALLHCPDRVSDYRGAVYLFLQAHDILSSPTVEYQTSAGQKYESKKAFDEWMKKAQLIRSVQTCINSPTFLWRHRKLVESSVETLRAVNGRRPPFILVNNRYSEEP
jgi:hypothetical protein